VDEAFIEQLDRLGVDQVRQRVLNNTYAGRRRDTAQAWLDQKAMAQLLAREAQAASIASRAADAAERAANAATEQAKQAQRANWIAAAAFALSLVAAIMSLIALVHTLAGGPGH
jgi:hypothetical protein